jgi:hypothetical protein
MKRPSTLVIGASLFVAGIAGLAAQALVPPSKLAQEGQRTLGEVLFKDSRPGADGTFTYSVTFVFPDSDRRNHQVTRVVPDKAVWDRLRTRQEVRVRYMPQRPEEASIEGAEGLARPHAAAYAYVAWSAILAGGVMAFLALKAKLLPPDRGVGTGQEVSGDGPAPSRRIKSVRVSRR